MPHYKRRAKRTQGAGEHIEGEPLTDVLTRTSAAPSFTEVEAIPSAQKFHDLFHAERGDLFFGLGNVIGNYRTWWGMISFRQDYMAIVFGPEQAIKVATDILKPENTEALFSGSESQKKEVSRSIENNFHQSIRDGGPPKPWWLFIRFPESSKNAPLREKFINHIGRDDYRYSISKIVLESFNELVNRADESDEKEHIINNRWTLDTGKKVITRGSKAALDMILKSTGDDKIHFILDGIDLNKVINKEEVGHNYSDRSTTAAELRFLFRHKDEIRNKVNFYMHGSQVPAPWLTHPERWVVYKPKSL